MICTRQSLPRSTERLQVGGTRSAYPPLDPISSMWQPQQAGVELHFRVLVSVTCLGSGSDLNEPVIRRRNLGRFFSLSGGGGLVNVCSDIQITMSHHIDDCHAYELNICL